MNNSGEFGRASRFRGAACTLMIAAVAVFTALGSPADAASAPSRNNLQGAINAWMGSHAGDKSLIVHDVTTNRWWSYNTGMISYEASISKVDILATRLFQTQARGKLSPTDQALATKMITQSDNDAASSLYAEDGGAAGVNAFNALTRRMPNTAMKSVSWGGSRTPVGDQLGLMEVLGNSGYLLSDASRNYELNLMEHIIPVDKFGVTGGVPATTTVAVKNGWLPLIAPNSDWQINSIGWVHDQGHNYFFAYMSYQMPSYAYGIAVANGIGSIVYDHLTTTPTAPTHT